ncbi:MAG TPA: PEP-CTERM sorting domain-containing protein [Verrucomicrobiae bacterium]|nr:PEP-CTERM sorting domain-containing protein [Verrucomicrobiae bacterium]
MKHSYPLILAMGALCFVFQSAQATLLFSEAFNYTAPGALQNQVNPGNSATWTGGNSGLTIASGNLTYAGLADQGGNELSIANGTAGSSEIQFANQTSGQIYYSFLFNPSVVNSGNNYFTAMNPGTSTPNGGSDAIDAYYYSTGKIELRGNAQAATAGTGPVLTLNTTYLIVEMIDLTAHTASLWVNPDSSTFGNTAPTATATLSGLTATAIDNVGFKAQSGTGAFLVDNLLIGTTWADVTPAGVPEPSTFALAGLGILGWISARRRMRK